MVGSPLDRHLVAIRKALADGKPLAEIGAAYGVTGPTIAKFAKRHGLVRNPARVRRSPQDHEAIQ